VASCHGLHLFASEIVARTSPDKPRISVQTPTASLISSVVVIALGTAIAGYGELNSSIVGMLIQMISESAEAGRLIMTQTLLQGTMTFHPIEGLMYLAPASVVWMALFAGCFEVPKMLRTGALRIVFDNQGLFVLAATMGFAVTALAMFTIQLCGSLTLKVSPESGPLESNFGLGQVRGSFRNSFMLCSRGWYTLSICMVKHTVQMTIAACAPCFIARCMLSGRQHCIGAIEPLGSIICGEST
jgi:hypothetical protein